MNGIVLLIRTLLLVLDSNYVYENRTRAPHLVHVVMKAFELGCVIVAVSRLPRRAWAGVLEVSTLACAAKHCVEEADGQVPLFLRQLELSERMDYEAMAQVASTQQRHQVFQTMVLLLVWRMYCYIPEYLRTSFSVLFGVSLLPAK